MLIAYEGPTLASLAVSSPRSLHETPQALLTVIHSSAVWSTRNLHVPPTISRQTKASSPAASPTCDTQWQGHDSRCPSSKQSASWPRKSSSCREAEPLQAILWLLILYLSKKQILLFFFARIRGSPREKSNS